MKKLFITISLLIFASSAVCQEGTYVYNKLKAKYDYVYYYSENDSYNTPGYYQVKKNDLLGICDYDGNEVITPNYKSLVFDKKSKTFLVEKNGFEGIIDITGKTIIPATKYSRIKYDDNNYNRQSNYYKVYLNDKVGMVDVTGKLIIPALKYTNITYRQYDSLFLSYINYNTGLLDKTGKELLSPVDEFDYLSIVTCYDNNKVATRFPQFILVKKNGDKGYGVVGKNGKYIIPRNNAWPDYYPENNLFVCADHTNDSYKVFTGKGNLLFDGERAYVSQGVILFKKDGLWGMMNASDGTELIERKYTSMGEKFDDNGLIKASIGSESFLLKNPLQGGGAVSSLTVSAGQKSDVDFNIPEKEEKNKNAFAVIIANSNYNGFYVPYAINDGQVFQEYCLKTLGIPKSNIMYQEDATLNNIRSIMTHMSDIADVYDGEAQILFYFSGIGMADNNKNGYLLPSDGSLEMLQTTGYSLHELHELLGNLDVAQAIAIIDAGFSAQNRDGQSLVKDYQPLLSVKVEPTQGKLAVLMAANTDETAYGHKNKQHGLFTYYLCKKLQETAGDVNLHDLAEYVSKNVRETAKKELDKIQIPQIYNSESINIKKIKL